jgi:hypothetical protein
LDYEFDNDESHADDMLLGSEYDEEDDDSSVGLPGRNKDKLILNLAYCTTKTCHHSPRKEYKGSPLNI